VKNRVHNDYYIGFNEGYKTAMHLAKARIELAEEESSSLYDMVSKKFLRIDITNVLEKYLHDFYNRLKGQ
jgi:hypothetical protein